MLQEAITRVGFVPFAVGDMKEPIRLNDRWAGPCPCGDVLFAYLG